MIISNEEERRAKFRKFLFSLAKSQDYLQDKTNRYATYIQLEEIYHTEDTNDFRHFYSDIFSVLTVIKSDSGLGDIDVLGQNMAIIREEYQPKNYDANGNQIDISDSIRKLYDHVSLDIARIRYSENQNRLYLGQDGLDDIKAKINEVDAKLPDVQRKMADEVEEVKKELKASQKEYISILGIFSAVVLAFTGGIAFSTSVLENIHLASIYRTSFICLIIAFILLNVLYLLFKYIEKIVCEPKHEKKSIFKEHFPIIIADGIIITAMVAIILSWTFGLVETRNKNITGHNLTYSEIVPEVDPSNEITS